jgi:uncharacterized protein (UPF0335 family)
MKTLESIVTHKETPIPQRHEAALPSAGSVPKATAAHLKSLIERIEAIDAKHAAIVDNLKEVYAEAKEIGYDLRTLRSVVRIRKLEVQNRGEAEALPETYKQASERL